MSNVSLSWKKFSRFLLLGISFLVLLAGISQSSNGLTSASAVDCQQQGGCPPPQPQPPVECTTSCPSGKTGTCGGHKYWVWADNKYGDCQCETEAQTCSTPTPPQPETRETCKGQMTKDFLCSQLRGADPGHSCDNWDTMIVDFNHAACPPAIPAAPAAPQTNCFVCDNTGFDDGQGRWRSGSCPANPPACEANNRSTFGGCVGATNGAICETRTAPTAAPTSTPAPAPAAAPTAQPIQVAAAVSANENLNLNANRNTQVNNQYQNFSNSISNSNSNTVTVTTPAAPAPQVVLAQAPQGNVGVGTAATSATTLPKTGLPALAWAISAFIPAGFKMKKFGKGGQQADDGNPNYLWENREFKRQA